MISVGGECEPAAALPAKHVAYITARFAATAVRADPFPHLVIPDVLPLDVYAAMEADSPSSVEWTLAGCVETFRVQSRTHTEGRPHFAAAILAAGDCLAILARNHGRFIQPMFGVRPKNPVSFGLGRYFTLWRKYQAYFDLVDKLALQAYRPHLESYMNSLRRLGVLRGMPSTHFAQSVFCQRLEGWLIGPHVHDLPQIIQSMIYFPLPRSHPEQGTILYRPRRPISIASSKLFAERGDSDHEEAESPQATLCFEEHDVERVDLMPYVPNTLASFLNSPLSIHGTVAVPDAPARRYVFTAAAFSRNAFSRGSDHTIALAELSLN